MKCSTKIREELRIKRAQYQRRWERLFKPGTAHAVRRRTLEKKIAVIDRYLDRCRW